MAGQSRLRNFVSDLARLLAAEPDEAALLGEGGVLLRELVRHDDWLPDELAQPSPTRYRQNLLHCDALEHFSVVSFVWGPGQTTPIHNHTVWGLIGMLRGTEWNQRFRRTAGGRLEPDGPRQTLRPGEIEAVSPSVGDIHQVGNALADAPSISIHVYGANIGAVERAVFDETGAAKPFISGYSNAALPNIWDRSSNPIGT